MNASITPILNGSISASGSQNRYNATVTQLESNGFLFDVSFTMPSGYTNKWDFLKNIYVNITLRMGNNGNKSSCGLVSNARLYDLLSYSDYIAGVSMKGTEFEANKLCRISGYVDNGYFKMSSADALEISLNIVSREHFPSAEINFVVSSVLNGVQGSEFITYQSVDATGADQNYKNVLDIYYIGTGVNAESVVIDEIGTNNVNINSAIALSNATGRFEFFTDFGELYKEPFGISQNVAMRVPTTNNPSLLVRSYEFFPDRLARGVDETIAQKNALLEKIRQNDPDKYEYLALLGEYDD
jgi:hypothetical protein